MPEHEQVKKYQEQGFLVFEQIISPEWLLRIKNRAAKIIDEWQPDKDTSVFSTNDNDRSGDRYFLDSAEEVRCFFEEEAFDKEGKLVVEKSLSINKIGHALHLLDPVFREFCQLPVLGEIAKSVGLVKPEIRQSMYIFKQPKIGGVVNWHQDATFFFTTPQSVVTYWFALEDATLENGCLWVQPAGHNSPLREQFVRKGDCVSMRPLDDSPWPDESSAVPLEVKAGSLVVFPGLLPHYSAANRSPKSRQAFTLHVTDGRAEYVKENWLQSEKLPIAGLSRG